MEKLLLFISLILYALSNSTAAQTDCNIDNPIPFSTDTTHLTIWNGHEYQPFFIKGTNLGIAVPGKFPGEMEASREQYGRWFELINQAGFNSIRLYTLHYPHFYEVLDSFNLANPQNPLFFLQGVWLEEELEGYDYDLHFLTESFSREIEENVDCVHGNRVIEPRPGKAWGTYATDVSRWNIGYIIGREVHPGEVLRTNERHAQYTDFHGFHFAIEDVNATEVWVVEHLEQLVSYEYDNYETQRPVSFSSWPTLDPIQHPEEWDPWEDTTSIDLSRIQLLNAPAGYFASYHAYPYYPDYISYDPNYITWHDDYGPNSYLGYLTAMKKHYNRFPFIVAEFGVPSSWGIAHYSTSGMHHGGYDDFEQGEINIRLLKTIEAAGSGGGIHFSWLDEWFKRTWITDHIDYLADRRILWHNITAAEQNFGLMSFQRPLQMQLWEEFSSDDPIQKIEAAADYDFLHLKIHLKNSLSHPDEMWIALDTYSSELGESILPNGELTENRAEFALHLTNHSAMMYVTQAYDLYGIFHEVSAPEQQYRSVVSDGAPWKIVRWRNNNFEQDVQYIGNMKVNYGFLPPSSKDAVTLYTDHLHIRLPWSLLHFVDPSEYVVFHDDRSTPLPEDTISDGIALSVYYKDEVFTPQQRFLWEKWNTALDVDEVIKGSYWVMKDRLTEFNNKAIALCDSFSIRIDGYPVRPEVSVLDNDFDLDGNFMQALVLHPPLHGKVELDLDGHFTYYPDIAYYGGEDEFWYVIFDGFSLSAPARVSLSVENVTAIAEEVYSDVQPNTLLAYPNPASDYVRLQAYEPMSEARLFDLSGRMLQSWRFADDNEQILLTGSYPAGTYLLKVKSGDAYQLKKIQLMGR